MSEHHIDEQTPVTGIKESAEVWSDPYPDPATTTPKRVLLVQAHPDDAEFSCAATIAKWAADGAEIYYCSITSGDKGSSDAGMTGENLVAMREEEQREAARTLGVKDVHFLGYLDATLEPNLDLRRDITRVIRKVRPTAFVCQDPTMRFARREYINHPDHVAAGNAALAAVFPSCRDRLTFPELLAEGLEPVEVPHIYMFGASEPDCWIDVTSSMETKVAALRAHVSQVGEEDAARVVYEWAKAAAEAHPERPEGFGEYAETFKYMHIGSE